MADVVPHRGTFYFGDDSRVSTGGNVWRAPSAGSSSVRTCIRRMQKEESIGEDDVTVWGSMMDDTHTPKTPNGTRTERIEGTAQTTPLTCPRYKGSREQRSSSIIGRSKNGHLRAKCSPHTAPQNARWGVHLPRFAFVHGVERTSLL